VMVYKMANTEAPVALVSPDRYLTLGDPSEFIGEDAESGGGYVLGTP
jgi:hypothetical protein